MKRNARAIERRNIRRLLVERLMGMAFQAAGMLCIAVLAGILLMLLSNSIAFFKEVSLAEFLFSTRWDPDPERDDAVYGLPPLLAGTLLVTVGAMLIAAPVGVGAALFLAEYAHSRLARVLKPAIEMLAAVPSVVIGFLGIVVIGPGLARMLGLSSGLNALNGALLLAIMALPTIITISEDALRAVRHTLREASYSLGANPWQTISKIVLPAAFPGILAALMLGMGRAIGETMTVLMAAGNAAAFPRGWLDPARAITAAIAIEMGETPHRTTHYYGLFAIALALFLITLIVNLLAERLAQRFRRFQ